MVIAFTVLVGRAWLFMALNECLLESYIRCFQQNEKMTEEFYVNDALVRDQQVQSMVVLNLFYFLSISLNICFGCSKEPSP